MFYHMNFGYFKKKKEFIELFYSMISIQTKMTTAIELSYEKATQFLKKKVVLPMSVLCILCEV